MRSIELPSTRSRTLDDSGVVALVGLAMAVFLTGVLYYEIGIGDAITFKEKLQDATDASGFAAAVYHARGMNMVVLVNLIMAAVLAVVVMLKVLQLVIAVGIIIASLIPGAEELDAPFAEAEGYISPALRVVEPIVQTALKGLNTVSTAIAVGMPWVAMAKSGAVGGYSAYSGVTGASAKGGTVMLSMSLVPDITWIPYVSSAANSGKSFVNGKLGLDGGDESAVEGKRWGLPVEEGEFNVLCQQAGQVVPTLIEWVFIAGITHNPNASMPTWLNWVNKILGDLIGSWPQFFCDEDAVTGATDEANAIASEAKSKCTGDSTNFDSCLTQMGGALGTVSGPGAPPADASTTGACAKTTVDSSGNSITLGDAVTKARTTAGASGYPEFDSKACNAGESANLKKEAEESAADDSWKSMKASSLPKAVFPYAANGNDYMAVWSFGWGQFSDVEESGISIAQWTGSSDGKLTLAAPKGGSHTMLAKAEFFYDVDNPCEAGKAGEDPGTRGSSTLCGTKLNRPFWGDYASDTMWNPRWKARLRRVAPPMIPLGQIAGSGLTSLMTSALQKAAGAAGVTNPDDNAGSSDVIEFITSFAQIGGGMADGALSGEIEKAAGYTH